MSPRNTVVISTVALLPPYHLYITSHSLTKSAASSIVRKRVPERTIPGEERRAKSLIGSTAESLSTKQIRTSSKCWYQDG